MIRLPLAPLSGAKWSRCVGPAIYYQTRKWLHSYPTEDIKMSDDLSDYMEQNMRETGHPEYSEFAEAMRRMKGVSSVGWAYDDLYEIVFDPDGSSQVVVRALKLAADHGYRPIEIESFHVDQNKIHVEGTHPPTTIAIE